jgi:hypothetical protein
MSETVPHTSEPAPQPGPQRDAPAPSRTAGFRITALVVILIVGGVIAWLALRNTSSSNAPALQASAASEAQLADLATTLGHPIFWVGPQSGDTYELSQSSNGTVYIRYLPAGVAVGSSKPYLTVATYPFAGAYAALQTVAKQSGETAIKVGNGGLAVVAASYPASVHVAYPGVDYQVEVFDPTAGSATALVAGGKLKAFGTLSAGSAASLRPHALTPAGLRALAKRLNHPLYWVGGKAGDTYEVTQTSNGQVYIRYLPAGVKVGASQAYLTVGTYPYAGAFTAIQGLAKQSGTTTIKLSGGGLAVLDPKYPKSIHLAFPGSDYEVEVFSPSPSVVHQLVSTGRVTAIG